MLLAYIDAPAPHASPVIAAPRREIRYAEPVDTPTSMPGNVSRNTTTDNILANVVESLVALRSDLTVGPMLADSWQISPDGKTYVFKLRRGVTFHDGKPFTSAEVKWSFDYLMNPRNDYICRGAFNGREGAKVINVSTPDPYTAVFQIDRPNALFLAQMADPRCPLAMLSPSSVDSHGAWIKPVGTGPYVFAEWKKNQYVLLTPFAQYRSRKEAPSGMAGEKIAYANARFVIIPDASAQKSALMSGQIDAMAVDESDLPPADPRWKAVSGPGADPAVLLMQTRDPLLADVRIRRAIALAVDLPGVTRAVTDGHAEYNPSLVATADKLYSPAEALGYTQNLDEVRKLLAAAGYHGQTLKLETNRRFAHMYRQAIYMQSLLSKAGIHVDLQVVEWATQVSDFRSGNFQIMTFGYSARINPTLMYADVIGDKTKRPMVQWENPTARALLDSIAGVTDEQIRSRTLAGLHQLMLADVPLIVMFDSPDVTLVSSHLQNFTSWPLRRVRLFNVIKN